MDIFKQNCDISVPVRQGNNANYAWGKWYVFAGSSKKDTRKGNSGGKQKNRGSEWESKACNLLLVLDYPLLIFPNRRFLRLEN